MGSHGTLEPARVIVAIDFGTTFSGFAYAPMQSEEEDVQNFLETVSGYDRWPSQEKAGAKPYYKTQTSLLYMQESASAYAEYELRAWGWSASIEHAKLLKESGNSNRLDGKQFHFISKFTLALAGSNCYGESYSLPNGLTAERVIADYLHELSTIVEKELQEKFGPHLSIRDIQWCLTVPAMWEDAAKRQMKKCAERAGLVSGPSNAHGGGSPHPVIIVLEAEAASAYCLHYLKTSHQISLAAKSKILILHAGAGTVDVVLHEKMNSRTDCSRVKEICSSSSVALCGSTLVDAEFYKLLSRKIPCYGKFILENPSAVLKIQKIWEKIKVGFEGDVGTEFWVPAQLSRYWEDYSRKNGLHRPDSTYDEVEISLKEITAVFDGPVETILALIKDQLSQVAGKDVDALMVVGDFANSFYLINKIRTKFDIKAMPVINPTHPGKAVLTGAVAFGCPGKEILTARIALKTYGVGDYNRGASSGHPLIFNVFVRKGEEVDLDFCVKHKGASSDWVPKTEDTVDIEVYSTTSTNPSFVTDPGCQLECTLKFPYPASKKEPSFNVSMSFGRTSIEVSALGQNFKGQKAIAPSVTFNA